MNFEKQIHFEKFEIHFEMQEIHFEKSEIHFKKWEIHFEKFEIHFERFEIHFEKSEIHFEKRQPRVFFIFTRNTVLAHFEEHVTVVMLSGVRRQHGEGMQMNTQEYEPEISCKITSKL